MAVIVRRSALALAALLGTACGSQEPATGPDLAKGTTNGAQFAASPTAVDFSWPPGGSETITAKSQYVTTVSASSSNTGCATVSPASAPTRKPAGSSFYVATFTVTAAGVGSCTIRLVDKNGKAASVSVSVLAPLPDRIVYASDVNGGSDIYVMDLDGSHATRLTSTPDEEDFLAALSADGRKIVFVAATNDSWTPSMMSVDGSDRIALPLPAGSTDLALSPDRRRIAFSTPVESNHRIYTANLDGGNMRPVPIGSDPVDDGGVTWAGPLPGRIAFTRQGPRSIWVMNADGSSPLQLTPDDDPWFHQGPRIAAISPDGQRVAYECQPQPHIYNICIVKTDGTGKTALTDTAAPDTYPRWTRDGRIVFTSMRDGNKEIYIMNADGSGQTNLTNSPANESTGFVF